MLQGRVPLKLQNGRSSESGTVLVMVVGINIKHICDAISFLFAVVVSDSDIVWVINELIRQVVLRASWRPSDCG